MLWPLAKYIYIRPKPETGNGKPLNAKISKKSTKNSKKNKLRPGTPHTEYSTEKRPEVQQSRQETDFDFELCRNTKSKL